MNNLTKDEATELCNQFLSGTISDSEGADILVDLSTKGETPEEISGFSESLLNHSLPFPNRTKVFDLCGTGGSNLDRFNVSTAVAFVLGALGVKVAKHGNRGSKRPNGSFDLLEVLGINIDLDGERLSEILDETDLAFVYARRFHTAMRNVVNARQLANRRTIFNLAGPISNPANVTHQIIGVTDRNSISTMLNTLSLLNRERGVVVSGHPGIDEASISGDSEIADTIGTTAQLSPEDFGIQRLNYDNLPCGDADFNALEFWKLISGEGHVGIENMVCINASLSLFCTGSTDNLAEGVKLCRNVISKGKMKQTFDAYKNLSNKG